MHAKVSRQSAGTGRKCHAEMGETPEGPVMTRENDHPLRYALVNELHARPFPSLSAPCVAAYVAIKEPLDAQNRDRDADRAHLVDLSDIPATARPIRSRATHFSGQIGRSDLKWESHTEFVTYSAFTAGLPARPFDPAEEAVFPEDLAAAPGKQVASVSRRGDGARRGGDAGRSWKAGSCRESLAVARVVEGAAAAAAISASIRPGTCALPSLSVRAPDRGGSGASSSGCARSRPTGRYRCWG